MKVSAKSSIISQTLDEEIECLDKIIKNLLAIMSDINNKVIIDTGKYTVTHKNTQYYVDFIVNYYNKSIKRTITNSENIDIFLKVVKIILNHFKLASNLLQKFDPYKNNTKLK